MSVSKKVELPDPDPAEIPKEKLTFSEEELEQIDGFKKRYPTIRSTVMPVLWLAQEKFGYLPPEVLQLVADTLDLAYPDVYGVATFYTQYFKQPLGKWVLDVCTCFTCQMVGGYDSLAHLRERLGLVEGDTTDDKLFTVREAECLGACGSGPMLQITNGPYVHNLTPEKIDQLIENLKDDELPGFTSITLPQDEDDLGGNRRTDVDDVTSYVTQPTAKNLA